jgi:hypothetical protein
MSGRHGCAWERRAGVPCPICRSPTRRALGGTLTHDGALAAVRAQAEMGFFPSASDLADLVFVFGGIDVTRDEMLQIRLGEIPAILEWLTAPDPRARPASLGRPHIVGPVAGSCSGCGALLHLRAVGRGFVKWKRGQQVGIDCSGELRQARPRRAAKRKPQARRRARRKARR